MGPSSGGAGDGNSPALSQNSAPSHAPSGQPFYPGLGSGSLADQLARPLTSLDRVNSGYHEPGKLETQLQCMLSHVSCMQERKEKTRAVHALNGLVEEKPVCEPGFLDGQA